MENLINVLRSDVFLLSLFFINIILIIGFIVNLINFIKLNKKYKDFMKKLSNGKNIEEDLENYLYKVKKVEEQNANISNDIKELNKDLTTCIKKIGIVRYSAFQDTGSDLSFTLAMLDENNNGVVLNGIYSREMSNIYAKPINNGKSSYILSEEEKEAIQKAILNKKDVL